MEIDDILVKKKSKKINCCNKGKRSERDLVKILNNRFKDILEKNQEWGEFSRSIGSGSRHGQKVKLSAESKVIFGSDINCPPAFKFIVESKAGYNNIEFISLFESCQEIDEFLVQAEKDSEFCKKDPLVIWKKNYGVRIVFIKRVITGYTRMIYKDWTILALDNLLKLPDEFFFLI